MRGEEESGRLWMEPADGGPSLTPTAPAAAPRPTSHAAAPPLLGQRSSGSITSPPAEFARRTIPWHWPPPRYLPSPPCPAQAGFGTCLLALDSCTTILGKVETRRDSIRYPYRPDPAFTRGGHRGRIPSHLVQHRTGARNSDGEIGDASVHILTGSLLQYLAKQSQPVSWSG